MASGISEPTLFFLSSELYNYKASSSYLQSWKKRVKEKQQEKSSSFFFSIFFSLSRDNNNNIYCIFLIGSDLVRPNDRHRFLPPKLLLLRNELLYRAPELLVAHLHRLRLLPAGFLLSPADLSLRPAKFPLLRRRGPLRRAPPILFLRIGSRFRIRIFENNVLSFVGDLLLGADLLVVGAFAVLEELVVDIGAGEAADGRSAGELAGFGDERNDDGVAEEEDEARADEEDAELPEEVAGISGGDRKARGEPGEEEEYEAYLGESEKGRDLSDLIVSPHRHRFLRFNGPDLEIHTVQKQNKKKKQYLADSCYCARLRNGRKWRVSTFRAFDWRGKREEQGKSTEKTGKVGKVLPVFSRKVESGDLDFPRKV